MIAIFRLQRASASAVFAEERARKLKGSVFMPFALLSDASP
jgi:hypothetical protein